MVWVQMKSKLAALLALTGVALGGLQGCGSDAPLPPVESTASAPASTTSDVAVIAETTMHVTNGVLTIDPVVASDGSTGPGVAVQGFGPLSTGKGLIGFSTGTDGPGTGSCTASQYCAQITTQNLTGRILDNAYVEITSYLDVSPAGTPISWAGAAVTASTTYKSAFANFSTTIEAATIGTLAIGASNTQEFKFNAGAANCAATSTCSTTFSYRVSVLGSFERTSFSGTFQTKQATLDACTMAGAVKPAILTNADDAEFQTLMPFAYTMFDLTYDSAVIGSNGYLVFYKSGGTPPSLSANNDNITQLNHPAGFYVFWDDLEFDGGNGVCTAVSGTTPNRLWTVTWKNARLNPSQPGKPAGVRPAGWTTQTISFSLQVREQIDQAIFAYNPPTGTIIGLMQGSSATAGVHEIHAGKEEGVLNIFNNLSPYLPTDPTSYGTRIVRAAYVANP